MTVKDSGNRCFPIDDFTKVPSWSLDDAKLIL